MITVPVIRLCCLIPVIDNHITRLRCNSTIFNPDPQLFKNLHMLLNTALPADQLTASCLDPCSRHTGIAPFIRILHRISSGKRLHTVIQINNLLKLSIGLTEPKPAPHHIQNTLSSLCHSLASPFIKSCQFILTDHLHAVFHIGKRSGIPISTDGFQILLRIPDSLQVSVPFQLNKLKITLHALFHGIKHPEIITDGSQRPFHVFFLCTHIYRPASPSGAAFQSEIIMVLTGQPALTPSRFQHCLCDHRRVHQNPILPCILLHISRNICDKFLPCNPHSPSLPSPLSCSCSNTSFIFCGIGSPRCPAFSNKLTPSLEI